MHSKNATTLLGFIAAIKLDRIRNLVFCALLTVMGHIRVKIKSVSITSQILIHCLLHIPQFQTCLPQNVLSVASACLLVDFQ